jgi:hypothetical protein
MGDSNHSIMVACNNRQYCIGIVKAKPTSAVSIIETDCEVDFAPPRLIILIVPASEALADLLKTKLLMLKMNQNSNHLLVPENGWMVRVQNNKFPKSLQLLSACTFCTYRLGQKGKSANCCTFRSLHFHTPENMKACFLFRCKQQETSTSTTKGDC